MTSLLRLGSEGNAGQQHVSVQCTPWLVLEDGVNWRILLPGCDAAMRKSELLTELGVVASSSMTYRLHGAALSRGFISSSSSSL